MRSTSNSTIILVQFAMNKHLQFFSRLQSQLDLGPDYMSRVGVSLPGSQRVCQTEQKSTSRLHENRASPVSRDPGIAVPGSLLNGLRFYHVIAVAWSARLIQLSQIKESL